jgi:holo-[acyl-carrier protein] synthase
MNIVGHGIDLVHIPRVQEMVEAHGQRFLDRCFTAAEQAHCLSGAGGTGGAGGGKRRYEHLAGRFAAKEAILKALGTGWRAGIAWTDMEILPDGQGAPVVQLTGQTAQIAAARGITGWFLSISHVETHATASAIAVDAG